MDVQLKRGLLDICVLAAIRSAFLEISESTLYPILRRLEEAGCLSVRSVEHNGRLRKYYHITDAGLKRIDEFLSDWHMIQGIYEFIARGNRT